MLLSKCILKNFIDDETESPVDISGSDAGTYFSESDQIPVVLSVNNGIATFTVDSEIEVNTSDTQGVADADISLVLTDISFTESSEEDETFNDETQETTQTEDGTSDGTIDFDITGTVSLGTVELSVDDGSVTGDIATEFSESQTFGNGFSNDFEETTELEGLLFDVEITLSQIASESITDPLTFTGGLELSLQASTFLIRVRQK